MEKKVLLLMRLQRQEKESLENCSTVQKKKQVQVVVANKIMAVEAPE